MAHSGGAFSSERVRVSANYTAEDDDDNSSGDSRSAAASRSGSGVAGHHRRPSTASSSRSTAAAASAAAAAAVATAVADSLQADPPPLVLTRTSNRGAAAASAAAPPPLLAAASSTAHPPATASPRVRSVLRSAHTTGDTPLQSAYEGILEMPFVDTNWAVHTIPFQIVMIGDGNVGKTSLVLNFRSGCNGTGRLDHAETIGANYVTLHTKLVEATRTALLFQIWDTAGQERFKAITTGYLRQANVVIMVYDLTKPETLENLILYWWPEVKQKALAERFPEIIFVGNKTDAYTLTPRTVVFQDSLTAPIVMPLDQLKQEHRQRLTRDTKIDAEPGTNFFFVSAQNGTNVTDVLLAAKRLATKDNASIDRALAGNPGPSIRPGTGGTINGTVRLQARAGRPTAPTTSANPCGC